MSDRDKTVAGQDDVLGQPTGLDVARQRIAGQLAGAVAHDLNNMLATILGCLELMERRVEEPDRFKALIKRASDAVERAAGLTSRLTQFARRQPQPKLSTEVNALMADLMPLMASALGRRIRLAIETPPASTFIHVDPTALEATLLAFCLAARTAIPEAGLVTFATHASGPDPRILLSASGPGFDKLDLTQSRSVAVIAGLTTQIDYVADRAEVAITLSSVTL